MDRVFQTISRSVRRVFQAFEGPEHPITVLAAVVTVFAATIYVLGTVTIGLSIRAEYTDAYPTAWYVTSLVPGTFVAVYGAKSLAWPSLINAIGAAVFAYVFAGISKWSTGELSNLYQDQKKDSDRTYKAVRVPLIEWSQSGWPYPRPRWPYPQDSASIYLINSSEGGFGRWRFGFKVFGLSFGFFKLGFYAFGLSFGFFKWGITAFGYRFGVYKDGDESGIEFANPLLIVLQLLYVAAILAVLFVYLLLSVYVAGQLFGVDLLPPEGYGRREKLFLVYAALVAIGTAPAYLVFLMGLRAGGNDEATNRGLVLGGLVVIYAFAVLGALPLAGVREARPLPHACWFEEETSEEGKAFPKGKPLKEGLLAAQIDSQFYLVEKGRRGVAIVPGDKGRLFVVEDSEACQEAARPETPTIGSPSDGSYDNDGSITVSGTAEPGSTVELFEDDAKVGEATADSSGNFSVTLTGVSAGSRAYHVTATDAAGNESANSDEVTVFVDTKAPDVPEITGPSDDSYDNDGSVTISGAAESGSTVKIFEGSSEVGEATADSSGDFSATLTNVPEGDHTYHATATDSAGNESAESTGVTVTVDKMDPDAPTINGPSDGSYDNDGNVTVSETAEANSTVKVYEGDSSVVGEATADSSGDYSVVLANVSEGSHTYTATATDAAGNESAGSDEVTVTVDTTDPNVPEVTSPSDGSYDNDGNVTLSGTAEAGSTVKVYEGDTKIGEATADSSGKFSVALANVSEGSHTYHATATDSADNESSNSDEVAVTVDTTDPGAPTIDSPSDGSYDNDGDFTVSGSSKKGRAPFSPRPPCER